MSFSQPSTAVLAAALPKQENTEAQSILMMLDRLDCTILYTYDSLMYLYS